MFSSIALPFCQIFNKNGLKIRFLEKFVSALMDYEGCSVRILRRASGAWCHKSPEYTTGIITGDTVSLFLFPPTLNFTLWPPLINSNVSLELLVSKSQETCGP